MNAFVKDKVRITLGKLEEFSIERVEEIPQLLYIPCAYKKNNELPVPDNTWGTFDRSDRVKGKDEHFWFYTTIRTPEVEEYEQVFLEFETGHEGEWDAKNPQGILYLNGSIRQGLDVNHREVLVEPNKEYKMHLYFYVGMIDGYSDVRVNIKIIDTRIKNLYYDMKVPYDAALCFDENDYSHIETMKYLDMACNILNFRDIYSNEFFESIENATKYMHEQYYQKVCGANKGIVNYVGHTHIDVAWYWTLAQTREKAQRSFSTVLALMEQYPDYVFMSSQPQLYEYVKEEAPEIYEKIKQRVKEGRWEVEGAMWLEADCNLSSGESLIRQIMFGKKFMKDEFGVESHILWLPDVFGYSSAMPQILVKSRVDTFVTSKISWNETNKMPYDTFLWQGIDGTEIFTYFLTAQTHDEYKANKIYTTYVGTIAPDMNLGTWERYQQKEYNDETIVTFGHGDGGGGPTAEMLEVAKRLQYGLPGMPKAQMSRTGDFLERVKDNFYYNCKESRRTPRWVGELYLEMHRGTYTSIAKIKKNNRECEFLCQETETLSVIDKLLFKKAYPAHELSKAWKLILLNQFHDIIPGSSIVEVYEESDRQYQVIRESIGQIRYNTINEIANQVQKEGIMVYNPNSFEVSGYVAYGDDLIYAENIPSFGWKVIEEKPNTCDVVIKEQYLENKFYRIKFDENYQMISLYDKEYEREVFAEEEKGNVLCLYEDYPRAYDNWEITSYYKDKSFVLDNVHSVTQKKGNGWAGFEVVRKYGNSTVTQLIRLYDKNRRIDVDNHIDWHEHHLVLKALFPVDIHSNRATYDVQFGNAERPTHQNTSWDMAKFEVCAHKWADLSEENYGVSILNDCKYGYGILGNEMSLTLLKCGTHPNPYADQGIHEFTYSIYPHGGGFKAGRTIEEAYLLNRPMCAVKTAGAGTLEAEYSLLECDKQNIMIETIKESEDGTGIVVRLYDAWNQKSRPTLKFGFDVSQIYVCDMMEQPLYQLEGTNEVTVDVKNFEIVTLLLK